MAFMKKAIKYSNFDAKDATPPMVFVVDDQQKHKMKRHSPQTHINLWAVCYFKWKVLLINL